MMDRRTTLGVLCALLGLVSVAQSACLHNADCFKQCDPTGQAYYLGLLSSDTHNPAIDICTALLATSDASLASMRTWDRNNVMSLLQDTRRSGQLSCDKWTALYKNDGDKEEKTAACNCIAKCFQEEISWNSNERRRDKQSRADMLKSWFGEDGSVKREMERALDALYAEISKRCDPKDHTANHGDFSTKSLIGSGSVFKTAMAAVVGSMMGEAKQAKLSELGRSESADTLLADINTKAASDLAGVLNTAKDAFQRNAKPAGLDTQWTNAKNFLEPYMKEISLKILDAHDLYRSKSDPLSIDDASPMSDDEWEATLKNPSNGSYGLMSNNFCMGCEKNAQDVNYQKQTCRERPWTACHGLVLDIQEQVPRPTPADGDDAAAGLRGNVGL